MKDSYKKAFSTFRRLCIISLLCVGLLIFTGCGGGDEGSGGGGGGASTYDASGKYIYVPQSNTLTLFTTTLSVNGQAQPPENKGIDNYNVTSLSGHSMTWHSQDEGDMEWSGGSGSADNIVGTWVLEDDQGNTIYTLTLDQSGNFQLSGNPPADKYLFMGWGNNSEDPDNSATFDDYIGNWSGSIITAFEDGNIEIDDFTLTVSGMNSYVGVFGNGDEIRGTFNDHKWVIDYYDNPDYTGYSINGFGYLQPELATMVINIIGTTGEVNNWTYRYITLIATEQP